VDFYYSFVTGKIKRCGSVVAIKSTLGWMLCGKTKESILPSQKERKNFFPCR